MERPSARALRELYEQNTNIMAHLRAMNGVAENDPEAVLISYDLQSGSYTRAWRDPAHRAVRDRYADQIAEVLGKLDGESVLEAGVGEATTLCSVVERLPKQPTVVAGCDIAWSRIAEARKHAAERGQVGHLFFTGDLFALPAEDASFDIVFTAHALEPNHGRETAALKELYRVARRWLVLFEPSYELGSEATRQRIEEHGYIRGLPTIAKELGWEIVEHRLLENPVRENNQTAVLVVRKPDVDEAGGHPELACPRCRLRLALHRENLFCGECLSVFPIIDGIPCLLPGNAILATKYVER